MHKVLAARTENSMGHVSPLPHVVNHELEKYAGAPAREHTRPGESKIGGARWRTWHGNKNRERENHYAESNEPWNEASTRSPIHARRSRDH
jgi:hypothetical protein